VIPHQSSSRLAAGPEPRQKVAQCCRLGQEGWAVRVAVPHPGYWPACFVGLALQEPVASKSTTLRRREESPRRKQENRPAFRSILQEGAGFRGRRSRLQLFANVSCSIEQLRQGPDPGPVPHALTRISRFAAAPCYGLTEAEKQGGERGSFIDGASSTLNGPVRTLWSILEGSGVLSSGSIDIVSTTTTDDGPKGAQGGADQIQHPERNSQNAGRSGSPAAGRPGPRRSREN